MSAEKPRLSELRIDENARTTGASRAAVPLALAVAVIAIGAGAWYWMSRPKAAEVKVVAVQRAGGATFSGPSAVARAQSPSPRCLREPGDPRLRTDVLLRRSLLIRDDPPSKPGVPRSSRDGRATNSQVISPE